MPLRSSGGEAMRDGVVFTPLLPPLPHVHCPVAAPTNCLQGRAVADTGFICSYFILFSNKARDIRGWRGFRPKRASRADDGPQRSPLNKFRFISLSLKPSSIHLCSAEVPLTIILFICTVLYVTLRLLKTTTLKRCVTADVNECLWK